MSFPNERTHNSTARRRKVINTIWKINRQTKLSPHPKHRLVHSRTLWCVDIARRNIHALRDRFVRRIHAKRNTNQCLAPHTVSRTHSPQHRKHNARSATRWCQLNLYLYANAYEYNPNKQCARSYTIGFSDFSLRTKVLSLAEL